MSKKTAYREKQVSQKNRKKKERKWTRNMLNKKEKKEIR